MSNRAAWHVPAASHMTRPEARDDARLFLALWPDAPLRAELAAQRDAWRWPAGAAPVPDDKLHLTLHFIGAFARARLAALSDSLAGATMPAVTLQALDTEVWRGGIAVLRFTLAPELLALHERLGAVLAGFGVGLDERPFSPHVTMARKARHAHAPAAPARINWTASAFALVETHSGAGGSYEVLRRFGE